MRKELFFLVLIILIILGIIIFFVDRSKKEQVYFEWNYKNTISFIFVIKDDNAILMSMKGIFINMKTGNIRYLDMIVYTGYEDLKAHVSWSKDF
ncbi:hypothetical protein KZ870_40000, partial [Pseudomonas aeruginosa]|nr:hypothetical protein [Pseudomonas aeruginosa]